LQLLRVVNPKVKIVIFTDNKSKNSLNKIFIDEFKKEYQLQLTIKRNNNEFHDRYIFIDCGYNSQIVYHCGASSKDAGNGVCTISQINDKNIYKDVVERILKHDELEL
ncbi:MAG: ORF6N domain-containing protein, partial [Gammaproteobacteria bacterium]|nr:ORF6N domain-containing protein [Gammaproteobacteria bacterium]